ncbi:hypothetical protein NA57DRAFT_29464, partial [Rhizodiscina lignyota]
RCTVIGEGSSPKTRLLWSFIHGKPPEAYTPRTFKDSALTIREGDWWEDRRVRMSLFDTSGLEEYDKLRRMHYENTDVFLIVTPANATPAATATTGARGRHASMDNATKWEYDIRSRYYNTPYLIVRAKDPANDPTQPSSSDEGNNRKSSESESPWKNPGPLSLGAVKIVQCDLGSGEDIMTVFREVCI